MTSNLLCEAFVLDPRPRYPLVIPVKRYWHPDHCYTDDDALTLVTAHAISFSKEHWEPTLEHLYERLLAQTTLRVKVRDVWCIDAPNHGHAAVLNEQTLTYYYDEEFSWEEYARCVHAVLAGLGTGIGVDFSKRRLVGVGHSMGAAATILADTFMPEIKWTSMILIEPFIGPIPPKGDPELDIAPAIEKFMIENALKRKHLWRNREAALKTFQMMDSWDPRIAHIIVEHNIRDVPTLTYPDKTSGVTLSCPRDIEAACYRQRLTRARSFIYFCHLTTKLPIHLIYGDMHDLIPEFIPEKVLEGAKGRVASLTKLEDTGHLAVQMQPRGAARAIFAALDQDALNHLLSDVPLTPKL